MNWYKKAQSFQIIHDKYINLIKEFINESPINEKVITDKNWAKGACTTVSTQLVTFLKNKNIQAEVLECTGFVPDLPEDAHPDWLRFKGDNQKFLWHSVVKTEDVIIDLTGGQYGKVFSGIQIKPIENYLKNWQKHKPLDLSWIRNRNELV